MIPGLFDAAETVIGSLGILIHSAAHWETDSLVPAPESPRMDDSTHDRHFAVNSSAFGLLMTEFTDRYRRSGQQSDGRLVLIRGPGGITVRVFSPGPVQPGFMDHGANPLRRRGKR